MSKGEGMQWPVIGHEWAVAQLARALHYGRTRHAYLFTGPEQIGKTTLAHTFAAALNCTGPTPPCGQCRACTLIARNGHPDLTVVEAETGTEAIWAYERWKPDLVVVDHLQLLAGSEKVEELSRATRALKLTAERFQVPILCLSQLSRAVREDHNKPPRISRLRGSGTIENDSDTVVFVWRKRDENEQLTAEAAVIVAKVRMGVEEGRAEPSIGCVCARF